MQFALQQDNVWPTVDTPPVKRRKMWRKHSRPKYESDAEITSSLKRLKPSSSSDESISIIESYSSSIPEKEVCVHV